VRQPTTAYVKLFGTIKSRTGATHFQIKTLKHVDAEMALHVLTYNMKRVMRIPGVAGLMEAIRAHDGPRGPSHKRTRFYTAWTPIGHQACEA
jgi:hypothetical protein